MGWDYKHVDQQFEDLKPGIYRLKIVSAEKRQSQKGRDMLALKAQISGSALHVWHNIVFMPDHPDITNAKLTAMFDSFGIPEGDFRLGTYAGKVGAAMLRTGERGYLEVHYLVNKAKQAELPPFKDSGATAKQAAPEDEDVPF